MTLEHLWAGWRSEYVTSAATGSSDGDCVFCGLLGSDEPADKTLVVWRGERVAAVLNAYPYTNGHVMVMPVRHVGELEQLDDEEGTALWHAISSAVVALKAAYGPDGINVGANVGRVAGAGVPGHFHVHCLPRWNGDTNFMTTTANTRVLPEALASSFDKLKKAWPG